MFKKILRDVRKDSGERSRGFHVQEDSGECSRGFLGMLNKISGNLN